MRDYQCLANVYENIADFFIDENPKDILQNAATIAQIAIKRKEKWGENLVKLPFDHVLEAESLGAVPYFDSERIELRIVDAPYDDISQLEALGSINYNKGRMRQVLNAAQILVEQKEEVILNISGPITILNGLTDAEQIFRGFKKEPEKMNAIMLKLFGEIISFVEEGKKRGVKFFSYADPLAGVNIVGPKLLTELTEKYIFPLVTKIYKLLNDDEMLILCPKTGLSLIDMQKAGTSEIQLPKQMTYQEAILYLREKAVEEDKDRFKDKSYDKSNNQSNDKSKKKVNGKIVGTCCINNTDALFNTITEIVLSE